MDGRSSLLSFSSAPLPSACHESSPSATLASPDGGWRVSLVLPAYNEEDGIRQAVIEACTALAKLSSAYELLVVDDGSFDGTAAIVAELAAEHRQVRLLRHECNRGYGAALRTGFTAARFERVAFTDADCQFHLADLGRLLPLSDRYSLVVGWRQGRQDAWRRRFLSRGFNLLTQTLLGTRVRDCDCALKVFHREALPDLMPETNTFFVNAEMLTKARQRGLEVAEVGVRHRPRLRGESKVSLCEVPRIFAALLKFWWSRVLFAGDDSSTSPMRQRELPSSPRGRSGLVGLSLIMLIAVTLFFLRLRAPLLEPQEPRYAEIPRQMLSEGRWLVPVLHGEPYLDKPPLLYWLVMGSYSVFGVHDWVAQSGSRSGRRLDGAAHVRVGSPRPWRASWSVRSAGAVPVVRLHLSPAHAQHGQFAVLVGNGVAGVGACGVDGRTTCATARVAFGGSRLRTGTIDQGAGRTGADPDAAAPLYVPGPAPRSCPSCATGRFSFSCPRRWPRRGTSP